MDGDFCVFRANIVGSRIGKIVLVQHREHYDFENGGSYSIKKYIGAYAAVMGGLDAIVFGGGIGLNSPLVRALSLEGLEFLGVRLDGFKNRMAIAGMDISMEDAPVRVFTVHTDEEIIVARKAAALLATH